MSRQEGARERLAAGTRRKGAVGGRIHAGRVGAAETASAEIAAACKDKTSEPRPQKGDESDGALRTQTYDCARTAIVELQ